MRASTSSAVAISLLLHGFVVGLVILTTYFVAQRVKEAPVIFELVAGPRTNDGESLAAPALGNTDKPIKLEVPVVETVASMPEPEVPVVQTEPEPAAVEPPPPVAKPKPKPTETPKPPEKTVKKAKPDDSMVKEMRKSQRMSYNDYLKKHPTPKQAPAKASSGTKVATGKRIDVPGIVGGVKGGSTKSKSGEGGTALTREQQDQMSTYISMLIQELKRAHEPPPGVSDRLEARVTFDITASGAILNPRISKSSGDKEFDDSVIDAFLRMRTIGPTPNRRSHTWTVTFRMKDSE
jgi:colicin import membrane protein